MADTQTLDAATYSALGTERDRVALPTATFDGTVNEPVMHQAVKAFLANQRQGTAYTKTRGLVAGGNQKPWRQKGTGRARQGSTRAPHWPGGGTVFGPHGDRNYSEKVPRQVRALARKSALNVRARDGALMVVDRFNYQKPNTALLRAALERIGVADRKVLILTDGPKATVYLSGRNLPNVHVLPYSDVSTYHILWSDAVVIESSAIGTAMEPLKEDAAAVRPVRKNTRGREDEKTSEAPESGEERRAKKAVRKAAARKTTRAPAKKKTVKHPSAKKTAAKKPAAKKSAAKKSAPSKKKKGK